MQAQIFVFVPYLISILVSAVMASIYWKSLKSRHLLIMIPYLWWVFLQETILILGPYVAPHVSFYQSNAVIHNIYRPISVLVFAFIYYSIPFMGRFRKLIALVTILYLLVTAANYCFFESILRTSSYLAVARGFVITFCAVLFLFGYFSLDNFEYEKFWHPLVWITGVVVVFYPVVTISLHFQKYLAANSATFHGLKLYHLIPQVMSIFMYSCFSYAFYLCQRKN